MLSWLDLESIPKKKIASWGEGPATLVGITSGGMTPLT